MSLAQMYNETKKVPLVKKPSEESVQLKSSVELLQRDLVVVKDAVQNCVAENVRVAKQVESLGKSKLSTEFNEFVVKYNENLLELQNCLVDLSKRVAVLEAVNA